MKKEFGKWLMDIAKYLMTAVLLSTWFNGIGDWNTITHILICVAVVGVLILGLYFTKESKE
ncbi:MAG: hypothetical protein IJ213_04305 [Bacteroidales bacterium]|nr:hypothetical protein [Bacteroidales bacterium]MBQ9312250.1 hypothetical protein [Bacteroidales bacterium]